MDAYTQAFVVRIWLEDKDSSSGIALWRGYVIHVNSGEQRHVKTLSELMAVFADHLDGMGARPSLWQRISRKILS